MPEPYMYYILVLNLGNFLLETEGPRVPASPASLRCVLEQDTLILA